MNSNLFTVYILSLIGSFAICQKTPTTIHEPYITQVDTMATASKLLTLADAEKIMGERAKLTGNTFIKKGDTLP